MQIPFIGAAYEARSSNFDAQRCVNLYPELAPPQPATGVPAAKNVAMLVGTPGLSLWTTLPGTGAVRALYRTTNNLLVAVQGSSVYLVDSSKTATYAGNLTSSSGPVSIIDNGTYAALADGNNAWSLLLTAGSTISSLGVTAGMVTYIDGYFIFNQPGTEQFFISSLDSITLPGADYASAEGWPDNLVALIADHRELWLFGDQTTEVWFDSGDVNFPFARIDGAFMEVGCAAPFSVSKIDNSIYWLGKDQRGQGTVWRANGYTPVRISTHAIESQIASYATISDAQAFSYQQAGHVFYVLTFPTADRTWAYDVASGMWHERAWHDSNGAPHRHLANCFANFSGKLLVGDYRNGKIYALDLDTFTDNGDAIHRIRAAQHISDPDYRWMLWASLQVDLQGGVGLVSGQGSDPQAMLQWSDDGGHTWSNEHWATMGKLGKYANRTIWRRLGKSRDRVFRLTITDPVRVILIGASANVRTSAA